MCLLVSHSVCVPIIITEFMATLISINDSSKCFHRANPIKVELCTLFTMVKECAQIFPLLIYEPIRHQMLNNKQLD